MSSPDTAMVQWAQTLTAYTKDKGHIHVSRAFEKLGYFPCDPANILELYDYVNFSTSIDEETTNRVLGAKALDAIITTLEEAYHEEAVRAAEFEQVIHAC